MDATREEDVRHEDESRWQENGGGGSEPPIDGQEGDAPEGDEPPREESRKRPREDDERPARKPDPSEVGRQVYVGNLDFRTPRNRIEEEFGKYGTVEDVYLPVDERRQPRGFCFVTFGAPNEAEAACEALNEREFDGRVIRVNIARPRPPAQSRPRRDDHSYRHDYRDRPRRPHPGKIFIAGLPDDINEREIDDLYYKYGRIDYIEIRRSSRTQRVQGVVACVTCDAST